MNEELIDWLLSSQQADAAIVPCTTHGVKNIVFEDFCEIVRRWDGVFIDSRQGTVSVFQHGTICFVSVNQGVDFLNGRTWNYVFELQGPRQYKGYAEYDFMKTLLRRIEPRTRTSETQEKIEVHSGARQRPR